MFLNGEQGDYALPRRCKKLAVHAAGFCDVLREAFVSVCDG